MVNFFPQIPYFIGKIKGRNMYVPPAQEFLKNTNAQFSHLQKNKFSQKKIKILTQKLIVNLNSTDNFTISEIR